MTRETSPLLQHPAQVGTASSPDHDLTPPSAEADDRALQTNPNYPTAVAIMFAICFVADIGGSLISAPEVRLLEMAVCRDYYCEHDPSVIGKPPLSYVDEHLCKANDIQTRLAYLRATKALLMTMPGIVLTIPYGYLSDRIGRRPVVFLALLGQILTIFCSVLICYYHQVFSTDLVLLSPFFTVIGGGNRVLMSAMNSVIVDVSPSSMRGPIFYGIAAGLLVTETIMVPTGSWFLSRDLWLPFQIAGPVFIASLALVVALPETHSILKASIPEDLSIDTYRTPNGQSKKESTLIRFLNTATIKLKHVLKALSKPRREIRYCLTIIFISTFARQSGHIFIQYASKLLDWQIATAGYLISIKSIVSLILLLSLAAVSHYIGKYAEDTSMRLHRSVVLLSLSALGLGSTFLGLSKNAATFIIGAIFDSAGYGISQALQSILASYADETSTGELFASLALVELLAGLSGNFAFAGFFDLGLKLRYDWGIGLPYLIATVLYVITILISWSLPSAR